MKQFHVIKKHILLWLPPFLLGVGLLCQDLLIPAAQWLADEVLFCPIFETTGRYCLGCGSTRSVMSLLHGNIPAAFHNNPAVPVGALCLLLWYAERIFAAFGKKMQLIPRSFRFWMVMLGIHIVWALLRNMIPAMQPL